MEKISDSIDMMGEASLYDKLFAIAYDAYHDAEKAMDIAIKGCKNVYGDDWKKPENN